MHDGLVHAAEHLVEDALAAEHGADRDVAARERLGDQHHVGLDAPMLDRQELAGAPETRLDLVGDE